MVVVAVTWLCLNSCTKQVGRKEVPTEVHKYPEEVAAILVNKCATSGCHSQKSKDAAAGLNLETWNTLFEGARSGAAVIPYRPDYSTLLYYTNSFNEYGTVQLNPKMPLNNEPLTKEEVKVLFDWVKKGAPDANGTIKFAEDPSRKKFYVSNQGCDVVGIFDAESLLAMRYVDVGETRGTEAPHMIQVAPDNQHWYVSFIAGGYFQKFRTSDNALVNKTNLGVGSWNTFVMSSDSKTAYVIDLSFPGKIAVVDLAGMTPTIYPGYNYPHGSALNHSDSFLYVTAQYGNYIYKFDVKNMSDPLKVVIDNTGVVSDSPSLDPHDIKFTPDGKKYLITCQGSNDVRILQTSNDSLLAVIPTGLFPQEMAVSKSTPFVFVTCMEDTSGSSLQRGSVYVLNYNTHSLVKSLYAGYQSHGVVVDDKYKRVYVANRNILNTGPSPHHQGVCSGRNGYLSAIDLNTLQLVPGFKPEVSIDPYGMAISH